MAAAEALGKIGDPSAVEPLVIALGAGNYEAATALGKIGDPRAVEPLIAALQADGATQSSVRENAAKALGKIGDLRAVEPLIAAVKHYNVAAATALGQLGDSRAIEPLVAALKRVNGGWEAAFALDKLGWSPDNGEDGARYWAARHGWAKCVEIGAPAVDSLIQVVRATTIETTGSTRKGAADALVSIYRAGTLDTAQQLRVLEKRDVMTRKHEDETQHHDYTESSDCRSRVDSSSHRDMGIGADFPV